VPVFHQNPDNYSFSFGHTFYEQHNSPKYDEFRDETKLKEEGANIPTVLRHTYISQQQLCRSRTAHIIPAVITNFMQTLNFTTQNAASLLSQTLSLEKQKRINYSLRTGRAQVLGRIMETKESVHTLHKANTQYNYSALCHLPIYPNTNSVTWMV